MMTGLVQDQKQIEKQMGCMSGFLQLFDRQQILAGKHVYSTKRLPPPTGTANVASPEAVRFVEYPASISREFVKPETPKSGVVQASPDRFQSSPVTELQLSSTRNVVPLETPPKSPLPPLRLPIFEMKGTKSSWKFCKEAPRLSLDSRAIVDAKGSLYPREIRTDHSVLSTNNSTVEGEDKQRRSPSVIARLMGLEQLPSTSSPEPVKKPELCRSASESRVSRGLFQSRFIDGNNFQLKQPNQSNNAVRENLTSNRPTSNVRAADPMEYSSRNVKSDPPRTSPWRSAQQRRSFFDSADFFPQPKQTTVSIYGDFEKKLKMRGIDEQSKDLETLKQILEALQLKGLLHSKKPSNRDSHRNFVIDRSFTYDESKIVLMKPWRSPGTNFGVRQNLTESLPSISPRQERTSIDRKILPVRVRNSASPTRIESNLKTPNSIVKRKPLSIETQRRPNDSSSEPRRVSLINSPKLTSKKFGSSEQSITNRSPRSKKPMDMIYSKEKIINDSIVTEDESSSSISESSTVNTSSQTDTEREGISLLERCDKLLHSIAEMNATESQPSYSNSVIPSPVSVLDSAFDKDESSTPSPVVKRSIDFKDPAVEVEVEDEIWSPAISPEKSTKCEEFISDDSDFVYISEILGASQYLPENSDVFLLLENQQYLTGKDSSKVPKLKRKLVFDITVEILDRNRQLPPWKADSGIAKLPSLKQIWSEFQRIRERETADDLLELICGVLRKDLAEINGWGEQPVEMSEAVLDIERLIFKDLVSETIGDLAEFAGKSTTLARRRKLVF